MYFFFSSRRRHTRCALVTGVQTCALPIYPCDARFLNGGPDPTTRQANCAAAGLKSDFESHIVDATARGTLSGNPDLHNEKAKALTFGVILAPRFLPGFNATVDWVDIRVNGAKIGRAHV